MRNKRRQIVVIGLGHFGAGLARALAKHCDVLALDSDMAQVQAIADDVQRALCLDVRDCQALAQVVSRDFDEAIVAIGQSIEASILCTLHLKRIGVPVIRAKATSRDHAEILSSLGASQTVFPELEMAERLALQIVDPNLLDYIPLGEDYRVMDVASPRAFWGRSLVDLQLRRRLGLFAIAIRRDGGATFAYLPGPDEVIREGDVMVLIGRESDLLRMEEGAEAGAADAPEARAPGAGGDEG